MIHVIAVAYERPVPMRILIDCFIVQTNPNWKLSIIYDGKAPQSIMDIMSLYNDPRIIFLESEQRNQQYGHPNRKMMLEKMDTSSEDFVLMTNDDNYYVPVFVQYMLEQVRGNVGMVYCDSVHSHFKYIHHQTQVRVDYIDIGSFMVRVDMAKRVGFNNWSFNGDGVYACLCFDMCKKNGLSVSYIPKPLFIHN